MTNYLCIMLVCALLRLVRVCELDTGVETVASLERKRPEELSSRLEPTDPIVHRV
jgi:hypothetical protein